MRKFLPISIILCLSGLFAKAQDSIVDATLYYVQISPNSPSAHGLKDTLKVLSRNADSIRFSITGEVARAEQYVATKNQIFLIKAPNTHILLYDYSLEQGDTFSLHYLDTFQFVVDSVSNNMLENGKSYRHWHLSILNSAWNEPFIWIENLGTPTGWNWLDPTRFHKPGVAAICQDDAVVLWNIPAKGYWKRVPEPRCDFDSLNLLLSNRVPINKRVSLYPNPVSERVRIEGVSTGTYQLFNSTGQEVMQGVWQQDLNVAQLPDGQYWLQLQEGDGYLNARFIKE